MVVFVGCSSSNDVDELYIRETEKIAQILCEHNCSLMFGSSEDGMMGTIYKVFKENGCKVISVLPKENYGMLQEVDSDEKIYVNQTSDQLKYLVNKKHFKCFLFYYLTEVILVMLLSISLTSSCFVNFITKSYTYIIYIYLFY